jgi:very-short-patch-repair endonuclease
VYIDGPHHDRDRQKSLDNGVTALLENAGFTVVRFPADQQVWPSIVKTYAWLFGAPVAP